jgi:hypothetical protein
LTAKVIYDDNSVDSSASFTWKSADTSIAQIDTKGQLKGIDTGTVAISASYGSVSGQIEAIVVQNRLFNNSWTLISIQDINTDSVFYFPDDAPRKISIFFLFGRILSSDSVHSIIGYIGICNSGGGDCIIDGNKISFSQISNKGLSCIKYFEWTDYLIKNLRSAYEYSIDGNKLLIKSNYRYNLYFEKTL